MGGLHCIDIRYGIGVGALHFTSTAIGYKELEFQHHVQLSLTLQMEQTCLEFNTN